MNAIERLVRDAVSEALNVVTRGSLVLDIPNKRIEIADLVWRSLSSDENVVKRSSAIPVLERALKNMEPRGEDEAPASNVQININKLAADIGEVLRKGFADGIAELVKKVSESVAAGKAAVSRAPAPEKEKSAEYSSVMDEPINQLRELFKVVAAHLIESESLMVVVGGLHKRLDLSESYWCGVRTFDKLWDSGNVVLHKVFRTMTARQKSDKSSIPPTDNKSRDDEATEYRSQTSEAKTVWKVDMSLLVDHCGWSPSVVQVHLEKAMGRISNLNITSKPTLLTAMPFDPNNTNPTLKGKKAAIPYRMPGFWLVNYLGLDNTTKGSEIVEICDDAEGQHAKRLGHRGVFKLDLFHILHKVNEYGHED